MIKNISPIHFIDKLVKKNEPGQPFRLSDHQREVLRLAVDFDQAGRLPWDTILYSCIKEARQDHAQRRRHPSDGDSPKRHGTSC